LRNGRFYFCNNAHPDEAMTDPPAEEIAVLRDVSRRFDAAAIPYMLTGSLAMSFYTTPRMTRDIDVVAELERRDVDRIVQIFESDYYVSREAVSEAVRDRSSFNLIEQSSITKVDIFPRKRDRFREVEFARRRRVTIGDFATWLVTAEDLVIAKLLWMNTSPSEVQLRDVRALLHATLDLNYIEPWVSQLGLSAIWQEARQ
jgi:hypothetical protein